MQEEAVADMGTVLAVLAGATGLRDLRVDTRMGVRDAAVCGLLRQLTALSLGPLSSPVEAGPLNTLLYGLTGLQSLCLTFADGELRPGRHMHLASSDSDRLRFLLYLCVSIEKHLSTSGARCHACANVVV